MPPRARGVFSPLSATTPPAAVVSPTCRPQQRGSQLSNIFSRGGTPLRESPRGASVNGFRRQTPSGERTADRQRATRAKDVSLRTRLRLFSKLLEEDVEPPTHWRSAFLAFRSGRPRRGRVYRRRLRRCCSAPPRESVFYQRPFCCYALTAQDKDPGVPRRGGFRSTFDVMAADGARGGES